MNALPLPFPINKTTVLAVAGGVALLGLSLTVFIWSQGGLRGAGKSVAGGVVGAVGGVVEGTVIGIGDELGVPRTNLTACEQALAEGRKWDASFACPAGKFLGSFF